MKFSLLTEPWLRVYIKGKVQTLGLIPLFEQLEDISDIAGIPTEKISCLRFLTAIVQTALKGPADENEWETCRDTITSVSIEYLKKNKNLFNLYGDRPFLQVPYLSGEPNRHLFNINPNISTGNNHVLFDSSARTSKLRTIEDNGEIARYLLQVQVMSPGGNENRPRKDLKWGGKAINRVTSPALLNSRLVTIIEGENLLETLHYNLTTKDILSSKKISFGKPIWELDFSTQEKEAASIRSYLYNLVPLSRAIIINKEDQSMIYCGALKLPYLPGSEGKESFPYIDPWLTDIPVNKDKNRAYLGISPNKYPWRDLSSILSLTSEKYNNGPWAFRHFKETNDSIIRIYTGGICYDKAKPIMPMEWKFEIKVGILNEHSLNEYATYIKFADTATGYIKLALKKYLNLINKEKKSSNRKSSIYIAMNSDCLKNYWRALHKKSSILIDAIAEGRDIKEEWLKIIRHHAKSCFENVCEKHDNKNMSYYIDAFLTLEWGLNGIQ